MPVRSGKEDQARTLFSQGLTVTAIAKRLGLTRATITRYKAADRGTERDWDKHRADLKGSAPAPKPNLVSFDRPRGGRPPKAAARAVPAEGRDLAATIDNAIALVETLLATADNLQGVGGAASALVALGRYRQELESDEAKLAEIMNRYPHPHRLIEALREKGWGREQA